MTNIEMLNGITTELSDFLVEQTKNEIEAVKEDNYELAEAIKGIIQNTILSCAIIYSDYTTKDTNYWVEVFNKQYGMVHSEILNNFYRQL